MGVLQARGRGKDSRRAARNQLPMTEHEASRTLVKSTPELWAECSDAASLARHLGAFGEIRITKLEPETAVAWEGEEVRGTVTLEPSGWGTRVILTAVAQPGDEPTPGARPTHAAPPAPAPPAPAGAVEPVEELAEPAAEVAEPAAEVAEPAAEVAEPAAEVAEPAVVDAPEHVPEARPGFFRRLFGGRRRTAPAVVGDAASAPAPAPAAAQLGEEPLEEEPEGAVAPHELIPSQANPRAERAQTPSEPAAAALLEALDSLGRAHHRPYSRG